MDPEGEGASRNLPSHAVATLPPGNRRQPGVVVVVPEPFVAYGRWAEVAADAGVDAAALIAPATVVTASWVRLKCQYGCPEWNTRHTCPPRSPWPEETRRVLDEFSVALLLRHRDPRLLERLIPAIEREMFLAGHPKAFGMGAGPCRLCETCDLNARCRYPYLARPSMEACGIDVFATARAAGFPIRVATDPDEATDHYGLVLIE